jgi:2-polyprenyl-6-methoxyphenol hydroxylase-like FAD-dependent oxidoreductase
VLGVLPAILDCGFIYDHMSIFDPQRKLIVRHDFLLGNSRIPAVCALSRRQLHDILLGAAQKAGVEVRLGSTVSDMESRGDKVAVQFSDGRNDTFDLVAGFDGIRSDTRRWLVGNAFVPRPSGYGAWRVQVPRPDYVDGMEFLQGIGSKTGAMPLSDDLMYVFHIRPEAPDAFFERADMVDLFKTRLAQYDSYVAEVREKLNEQSDIVYSPIEPMLLPWPWFRGHVVIGGDAAHTVPPHLTQGAAMAAEDGYILAKEMMESSKPVETRLMAYSQKRYARCAFVYAFGMEWLQQEQSVRTPADLEIARAEFAQNASARIAASDRILNAPVF